MPPKMAYMILKYMRLISAEYDISEKQRISLIHRIMGTQPGQNVRIEPDTIEYTSYMTQFSQILNTEITLPLIELSLHEMVSSLEDQISVQDLSLLEPFFK